MNSNTPSDIEGDFLLAKARGEIRRYIIESGYAAPQRCGFFLPIVATHCIP